MTVQQGKKAESERFCFEQNRWRRRSILPWKSTFEKDFHVPAPASSEDHPDNNESPVISESLAQRENPLSPAELHLLYAGTSVPPHRYLAPALITALHSPAIALDPAQWFPGIEDVDFSRVAGDWLRTNGDTTFERLKSVEIDLGAGQLTAIVTIQQKCGYSGGPTTAGSREFVAFWVDWGTGFLYEGTASVVVHDLGTSRSAVQDHCLTLPVNLLSRASYCCGATNLIRLRAILSWNAPPSTTHPFAQAVWGDSLDRRMIISSPLVAGSGKESTSLSNSLPNHFARDCYSDDLENRTPLITHSCTNPAAFNRDAASC
jgi:hypothetical protein